MPSNLYGQHQCNRCLDMLHGGDMVESQGGRFCMECATALRLDRCSVCANWFSRYSMHLDFSNPSGYSYLCNTCYSFQYVRCDSCGDSLHIRDAYRHNGGLYCSDCYNDVYYDDYDDYNDSYYWDAKSFNPTENSFERIGHRDFGVEIETHTCGGYRDLHGKKGYLYWGAKRDGSISGIEFVSSKLRGDKGLESIERLCNYAHDKGWTANRDCGLHVHFNMQDESLSTLKAVALAYYLTHDVWASCVDSERKDNHFCGKHTTNLTEIAKIENFFDFADYNHRYQWLNFSAYSKHGTFEVRLHHGSVNATEICNWVRAHEAFIAWAKSVGFDGVKKALWVKDNSEKFAIAMDTLPVECAEYYDSKVKEVCNA